MGAIGEYDQSAGLDDEFGPGRNHNIAREGVRARPGLGARDGPGGGLVVGGDRGSRTDKGDEKARQHQHDEKVTAHASGVSHASRGIGNGFNHRVASSRRLDWRFGANSRHSGQIQLECDVGSPLNCIKHSVPTSGIVRTAIDAGLVTRTR